MFEKLTDKEKLTKLFMENDNLNETELFKKCKNILLNECFRQFPKFEERLEIKRMTKEQER